MAWERAKMMFPTGRVINNPNLTIEQLVEQNYETVSFDSRKMAREMVISIDNYTWDKNNNLTVSNIYSVYHHPYVDGTPYLSAYGEKMLVNFKQRAMEEKENVGFNYTGL